MNAPTDLELIQASRDDPSGFAVLFDRHFPAIHRYLNRRYGPEVADDVASRTFVVAFEKRANFRDDCLDARPWLYGIAGREVSRHWRSEERRLRAHGRMAEDRPADPYEQADSRADAGALRPAIAVALAELNRQERDVLLLVAWAELTYVEAAQALGVPIGTVRSRLSRAREKVRRRLLAHHSFANSALKADDFVPEGGLFDG
ncbi:MAG: sigma-70 family RNA polymerase sigma factor [Dehalococcoidia bacterium]|nr:sigma-70 family RNA polymerase sigma factor [Dehalococcoidia bacterium]